MHDVFVPVMGTAPDEVTLVSWLRSPGDAVEGDLFAVRPDVTGPAARPWRPLEALRHRATSCPVCNGVRPGLASAGRGRCARSPNIRSNIVYNR